MRLRRVLWPALLAATLLLIKGQPARTQSRFALRDGDRVVFFGDSITEQQLYTTNVEAYVATRFPRQNIRFFNAGWNGERVTGIFGLRTHTLLTVQRQCVEDYQRQGYERVPSTEEGKR